MIPVGLDAITPSLAERAVVALERIANALEPSDGSPSLHDYVSDICKALCGEIQGGICDAIGGVEDATREGSGAA